MAVSAAAFRTINFIVIIGAETSRMTIFQATLSAVVVSFSVERESENVETVKSSTRVSADGLHRTYVSPIKDPNVPVHLASILFNTTVRVADFSFTDFCLVTCRCHPYSF